MTLLETQRRMAAAMMTPLTPDDRMARRAPNGSTMKAEAAAFIKPNSRLSPVERLEIYSRSYWFRLLDSLRDDFPGLAAILGARAFERLARAYLAGCPSRSFTLRDLGSQLEGWLAQHPEHAGGNLELAGDMVRLEWAHIAAFDGAAEKVLGAEDLAELRPRLRLGLQPYISLLELSYPVDEIRVKANADEEGRTATSNVPAARMGREAARAVRPRRERIFVAVHRVDLSVYYRRLRGEEFRLLCALRAGHSIGTAIEIGFEGSSAAPGDIPELLRTWFSAWTQLGWLTPRRRANKGSRT
ncbi:MAG: putative DNA-binding domain-containing protein [Acidobacteria bacterium]|nr:putative DNA-binding domain-containing protein [Acidobacteriota bacterium]